MSRSRPNNSRLSSWLGGAQKLALFWRRNPFLAIALLIACLAAWPLISEPGLLNTTRGGGDSPFLLQRLQQLETALLGGHFPVRWMPDANYGYGFPFYNYYAPLSLYITVLFRFIGFSYVRSIQLSQLLGFLIAGLGMFYLGRRWLGSRWAGLLASASYTMAPFHMVNVYVRGDSLAEFWAMAFYPLLILAAENLLRVRPEIEKRKQALALFALSYGGLILSHNISALIFSPFLLLYFLLSWWQNSRGVGDKDSSTVATNSTAKSKYLLALAGMGLALALAAFFFLPALAETSLAQLGPATEGHFFYGNHFRGLDLIQPEFLFDYNPDGGIAFSMGLVQAVLAAAGVLTLVATLIRSKNKGRRSTPFIHPSRNLPNYLFILLTWLVTTWMITSLSTALWENLPLLPFVQFPWRFLSVQTVAVALSTAAIARLPWPRLLVPLAIFFILVSGLGRLETAHLTLSDADVTAVKLAQYEWFTGNIGTTVSAEYLPNTVSPRSYTSPWLSEGDRDRVQPLSGELTGSRLLNRTATRQTWLVAVETEAGLPEATLTFPTIFWPGWKAKIGGQTVNAWPAHGSGLIALDLPPGEHEVTLWLARTPVRLIADLLSLAAALFTGWLLLSARTWRPARAHVYAAVSVLLLAIGLRLWPEKTLSPDDLTWDFAQMGYLHHTPDGVPFDNGGLLESYELSQDELRAGETLLISLNWRADGGLPPRQMRLDLALPAANRFLEAPFLSTQTKTVGSGSATFELAIPENAPGGLYVPRLTMDDGHAMMSANRLRGDLFLRPVRVIERQLPAAEKDPPLAVRALSVRQRDSRTLDLQLAWLTRRPLGQNYKYALRLLDGNGLQISQFDSQPGYGFMPSTSWPAGRWLNIWTALSIPEEFSTQAPYKLMAQLYETDTLTAVLTRSLGELVREGDQLVFEVPQPLLSVPDGLVPSSAMFEGESGEGIIQLHGYQVEKSDERVSLVLYWGALAAGREEYTRFVHLSGQSGEQQPLVQSDGLARNNSYPTGQWIDGEVVIDPVVLHLEDVPAGDYQIYVGWYRKLGDQFPRLAAVDTDGVRYPSDRVPLPLTITVGGQ